MNSDPIRVLIVDDHAPFRAGLRAAYFRPGNGSSWRSGKWQ